jgi:TRAP-type C4-dicarboxylate transport system substrate-binding protein
MINRSCSRLLGKPSMNFLARLQGVAIYLAVAVWSFSGLLAQEVTLDVHHFLSPKAPAQAAFIRFSSTFMPARRSSALPIRSLDDLNGQGVRIPSRTGAWMLEALGAQGVGMPVPALPLALDKDIVDSVMIPQEIFPPLRLQDRVRTMTVGADDMRFGTAVFVFAMNKAAYDGLPADLQRIFDEHSGINLASEVGQVWMASENKAHGLIEASGVERIELSATETERMRRASEPVIDRWLSEI